MDRMMAESTNSIFLSISANILSISTVDLYVSAIAAICRHSAMMAETYKSFIEMDGMLADSV